MATNQRVETGYRPRELQQSIHREMARKRFSIVVAHRRFGKTVLALNTLIDAALRAKPQARFAYVAPYFRQAKDVAWGLLQTYTEPVPGCSVNQAELSVTLPHGSRIKLYGADNPDSLRGIGLNGLVIDELADIRPNTWGEVLRPTLASDRGWVLMIGTPKGVNLFSELFYAALDDDAWFAGHYPASKTGILDDDELAMIRATSTESQYAQEMECDFNAAVDNALLSLDVVLAAAGKHIPDADYMGAAKIIGVDVARFGDDRSVIFKRQGLYAHEPIVFHDIDNMELAGRVANEIRTFQPDAVFIDGGRGEGVIDRLRMLGHNVIEVAFGGKASNPHYYNKRSEMWGEMAEWLRSGGALPDNGSLKTDLCVPTYDLKTGRFRLESKDDIKKRGMKSPDLGDALALTFAEQVMPAGVMGIRNFRGRVTHDWDPFAA
ncbi:MAG: terminase large subunit domain-containing protein [Gammaproteobacteria bacterium]